MRKQIFTLVVMLLLGVSMYAQTGTLSIPKVYYLGENMPGTVAPLLPNEFGFEIWLKNTYANQWAYNAGQYGVSYNALLPGTLSITQLASGLGGKAPGTPLVVTTAPVHFRWPQNTFGDGGPFVLNGDSVLVSRVKVTSTVPLGAITPDLQLRSANPDRCAAYCYNPAPYNGNAGTARLITLVLVTYENPPLPVELSSFTANSMGREVKLSWETKSEVNSSKFMVERTAANTQNWINVGEVTASGNSNSPKSYSYTDKKLNSGKYSYRLKVVDNDGTFDYSKAVEIEVSLPKEYAISQNYPNPFNPSTRVDYQLPFDSKVTLDIYGITGEKVATMLNGDLAAGYYTVKINAGALNLASGVYIYRINATGSNNQNFVQVKKLMLTK